MSDEGKVLLGIFVGWPLLFVVGIYLFSPSKMQICLKAGYDWLGGDCVMGVTYE